MNYEDLKIKDSEISTQGVVAAPDRLTGTAQENKAVFDRLIKAVMAKKFNSFLDQFQEEFESLIEEIEESEKTRIEETVKLIKQYLEENPQFADWAEWDENKSSHVKNRTHYKQVPYPHAILMNNAILDFRFEMMELAGLGTDDVAEGVDYTVTWNGAKYKCKAYTYGGSVCLGNAALLGSSGNSGEPFVFEMMGADRCLVMKNTSAAATIILSVERHEFVELKKLDAEFLPDNLLAVESANVGQVAAVEAVDENGRPIKWKAIDPPAGDGKPGYSPTVAISDISGGHRIAITDANGIKTVDVMDGQKGATGPQGEKGDTGAQGEKGKDGVSATHQWSGTTLKVTSASGTSSADLKGAKGDKGDKGEAGADGKDGLDGNCVFYSTETFPDVEIGFGRTLSVDAVSLAGRTIQLNDMVLTADGLLWKVTNDYVSEDGTIGAKCVSNLRGAADAQGYSIYFSNELKTSTPKIGNNYYLSYADILLSNRPLTENDLVITADGHLWKIVWVTQDSVNATCLGNLMGADGTNGVSIYYSSHVFVSPHIGDTKVMERDTVLVPSDRNLAKGDLLITADGFLSSVHSFGEEHVSATILGSLKGAQGDAGKNGSAVFYSETYVGTHGDGTRIVSNRSWISNLFIDRDLEIGDLVIFKDGGMLTVVEAHTDTEGDFVGAYIGNLKGPKGDKGDKGDAGGVTTVNGIAPDENGNVQIETVGGVSSWDDLPAPMPSKFLSDGVPYVENGVLLEETEAVESTYPDYGKVWVINKAPKLTAEETYTVIYNGTSYECVCKDLSEMGFTDGSVALGNFSIGGLENTGEPFAMVIAPSYPAIINVDFTGATSVRIGISGEIAHKMDDRCMPDTARVLVVKFAEREDGSLVSLSHTYQQILRALREYVPVVGCVQNSEGRGFVSALVYCNYTDCWVTDVRDGSKWYRAIEYSQYYLDGDTSNKTIGNELWEKA